MLLPLDFKFVNTFQITPHTHHIHTHTYTHQCIDLHYIQYKFKKQETRLSVSCALKSLLCYEPPPSLNKWTKIGECCFVQSTVYIVGALTTITLIHQIFTIQKLVEFKCVVRCIFWDEINGRIGKNPLYCVFCVFSYEYVHCAWTCTESANITLHYTVRHRPQASN